ncbi:glycine--tRNA ligase [Candidatus Pacearchaeota archaeon]|nr:glycine--tRNA ligase [Candidatus Pacearchaeota archaeon]
MYIVKKTINGKEYYYLNKSIREGDKVRSKSVAYLGKDRKDAERKKTEIEETLKMADTIKQAKEIVGETVSNDNEVNDSDDAFEKEKITIEELTNFCKEKGFVFRSSDLYGGMSGFWDFGPLGVELFNNIKQDWWNFFVKSRDNMVGMEASIISHPKTWEASGHVANFNDIFVKCKNCTKTTKLDENEFGKVKCECGGEYENMGKFNLMFETKVGAIDPVSAYLRGETAQGMFMDFKLIQQTSRQQLPFGIAQIGRCFRNEIAPRDFLFRCREFHIAEFEFFINPDETNCELFSEIHREVKVRLLDSQTQEKDSDELREITIGQMVDEKRLGNWHAYWLAEQILWYQSLGLTEIKIREHTKDELSHYSSATFDVDYEYSFGSLEVAGNADRGQYDLLQHQKHSKQSQEIFDEKSKKKIVPRVIEPTFGIERAFLAVLTKGYTKDKKRDYVVLRIPAKLAPIKAAVFPIIKKPEYIEMAQSIVDDLRREWNIIYDKGGSVGRRYARNDEIGTPYCITVDADSEKGKDATIRDRDSTRQIRVKIKDLRDILRKLINKEIEFLKAGKIVDTRVK